MPFLPHHHDEAASNEYREEAERLEPRSLRTFTPTLAVPIKSAGIWHWTAEGRRLYDFTSGVLVANLGHNPTSWLQRFFSRMGWPRNMPTENPFVPAAPMTAYNAITPLETAASQGVIDLIRKTRFGNRLEQVMWAASGSEAIQKSLWTALARDRTRPMILATRNGFHGKKGLAGAVSGSETDRERDPRVRFISFPMAECRDIELRNELFDPAPYRRELDNLYRQFGRQIGTLITEPYLGGGGSFHPPKPYLQMLEAFCREHDIVFILDEVQSNFGRTGKMFAFESYEISPDLVVLGKGLGNGVPVAATVGRADLFAFMDYGEGSDTWSANPLSCAAVLATLEEFAAKDVFAELPQISQRIEDGLLRLKAFPFVAHVRGEAGGMVWGIEMREWQGRSAADWANDFVLSAYRGTPDRHEVGIHLLGPLSKKVIRVSPPLTITMEEADAAMSLLERTTELLCNANNYAEKREPLLVG